MAKKATPEKKRSVRNAARNFAESVLNTTALLRRDVMAKLLNPGKDIDGECGYPTVVSVEDMKRMYDRNDVAQRVVRLEPEESWSSVPEIYEDEDTDETAWEKDWKELEQKCNCLHYLERVDILSGIGNYGVLLFGLSDGLPLDEPVAGIDERTGEMITPGNLELLYLRPFSHSVVSVDKRELDAGCPRYGMPTMYSINFEDSVDSRFSTKRTMKVHWTRILHVADNRDESEIYGVPRMEAVYNRLLDLRKVLAGSAEMFWKGGFPGYSFEVMPELGDAEIDVDALQEQMEDYSKGLQRYLALGGVTAKSLSMQVADPKSHLESQMKVIAMTKGIPYRVFLGSEQAQLASEQDLHTWNRRVQRRQNQYLTPLLVRPFIDRLIAYGILPEVDAYMVKWPDRETPSDIEQMEVAKGRTEAMASYVGGNVAFLVAPKEYLMMVLGYTEEEAEVMEQSVGAMEEDHLLMPNPEEEEPKEKESKEKESKDDKDNV